MKYVEHILDRFTMYQVLTTVLSLYVVAAFGLNVFGVLLHGAAAFLLSLVVIMVTVCLAHYGLAKITRAPANIWSSVITGLIIFLIFTPTVELNGLLVLGLVAAVSIIGKYVVRYRNVHLINPVALAAVLAAVLGMAYASWWVGSVYLNLFILIGGILVTLKIRRIPMILAGVLASVLMAIVFAVLRGDTSDAFLSSLLLASPLWFFMTIMVTEPLSTPAGRGMQIFYGGFIGALSQIPFAVGPVFNSPELSLIIANLLVWPLSLRGRLTLTCLKVRQVAENTYEYVFRPSFRPSFVAGQYLEWALPHRSPDGRGTRRYFTVASSPTRLNLKLVVRTSPQGSTFKHALQQFDRQSIIHASQLAGDFVLPEDIAAYKYIFVAGGIGITPFLSHLEYCTDTKQPIDTHLFYCNKKIEDIAYADTLHNYSQLGVSTTHVLADPPPDWTGPSGYLTTQLVLETVPDVRERIIYLSGPPGMVSSYEKLFEQLGVPGGNIKTDYFPGLA